MLASKRILTVTVVATLIGLPLHSGRAQQPPPVPAPSRVQPSPAASGFTIASDSLLGTKVRDAQGRDIGEISKLLIDARQGKVVSAIIKKGGTLGVGGTEISVPWETPALQRDEKDRLVATLQQPLLEQAPAARKDQNGRQNGQPSASPGSGGQSGQKDQ